VPLEGGLECLPASRSGRGGIAATHLTSYPTSEKAAAALYFLGRDAEKAKRLGEAKAYYTEIADRFPGFFHAVLAREKLRENAIVRAESSKDIAEFLTKIPVPSAQSAAEFRPGGGDQGSH
jgi:Uncharacterized protein conserved in bacteria